VLSQICEKAFPKLRRRDQIDTGMQLIEIYSGASDSTNPRRLSALCRLYPRMSKCSTPPIGFIRIFAGESMLTPLIGGYEICPMRQVMAHEMAKHGDDEGAIRNYASSQLDPNLPDCILN